MNDEIVARLGTVPGPFYNETLICQKVTVISPMGGIFNGKQLLNFSMPVLFIQISIVFLLSRLLYLIIKPLKQSIISAQIMVGMILGRSFLGHYYPSATEKLFPFQGKINLHSFAQFGFIFHLFTLMLQMDTTIIWSTGKSSILIGITSAVLPGIVGSLIFIVIKKISTSVDESILNSIPPIIIVHCLSSFPVTTNLLADLKILNSELGRFASKTSMVNEIFCFFLTQIAGRIIAYSFWVAVESIASVAAFMIACIFGIRPFVLWLTKYTRHGEPLKEGHFCIIVLIVLLTAFSGEILGQNFAFGPLLLGMILPDAPQLRAELESRLDVLFTGLLLPSFFAISGLTTNLRSDDGMSTGVLEIMIIVTYVAKFMGTMVPAVCCGVQYLDALCLALIMCCKGSIDVAIYSNFKNAQMVNTDAFNLLLINFLIITGILRPLISYLYDPSKRYTISKRRALTNSNPTGELRLLVCIHNADNVPPVLNLLKACNPVRYNPVAVFVLHLMKLTGKSAAATLTSHCELDNLSATGYRSTNSMKAFDRFEEHFQGSLRVHHYTAVAPYKSMHADVCTIALDKRTSIVIVPFHKHWSVGGRVGSINPSIRLVNFNVMEMAPCSVGVLIDRGGIDTSDQSVLMPLSAYRIGMLFFGAEDDWEALALTGRLADNPYVTVLIVVLRHSWAVEHEDEYDKESSFQYLVRNFETPDKKGRVRFEEFTVDNGNQTTQVIRSLENILDLVIVGRNHDPRTTFASGLEEWKEYPELGMIGDMLSSSDFRFSVLVVVQQRLKPGTVDFQLLPYNSSRSMESRISSSSFLDD